MNIQEFENKVHHGSKIKIQHSHRVHKYGQEFEDGIWTFIGYTKCSTQCENSCPGSIILINENGYEEKGCYRNSAKSNIRLQFIKTWNLPNHLFEI